MLYGDRVIRVREVVGMDGLNMTIYRHYLILSYPSIHLYVADTLGWETNELTWCRIRHRLTHPFHPDYSEIPQKQDATYIHIYIHKKATGFPVLSLLHLPSVIKPNHCLYPAPYYSSPVRPVP